jgi:hypothetical protein
MKLLSIITVARNDNYFQGYLSRLEYVYNYTLKNIIDLNYLDIVDFNIVDWGSKKNLSEEISIFYEKGIKNIKFLNISDEFAAKKNKLCNGQMFIEFAEQLGFTQLNSKFVLTHPGDQFLSKNSLMNLINFLKNQKESNLNKMYILNRNILPIDFARKKISYNYLDRFLNNMNSFNSLINSNRVYSGGGMGGFLAKKEIFENIGGLKNINLENRGYFSFSDNDIIKRANKFYQNETLIEKGIILNKFPYTKSGSRTKVQQKALFIKDNLKKITLNRLDKKNISVKFGKFNKKNINEKSIYVNFLRQYSNVKNNRFTFYDLINAISDLNHNEKTDLNFAIVLNKLLRRLNCLGYFEIYSYSINRINSISRSNPFLEIYSILKSKFFFSTTKKWIKLMARFDSIHKTNLRITDQKLINNNLFNEIPGEGFSNIVLIDQFKDNNEEIQILQNIKVMKFRISLLFVNKNNYRLCKRIDQYKEYAYLTIFKEFRIYINSEIKSKKFRNEIKHFLLNNNFNFFKNFFIKILFYLLKLRLVYYFLKKNFYF